MKARAAVAWEAGQPPTIDTIDVEGPREAEVLLRIVATGVCHNDFGGVKGRSELPGYVERYLSGEIKIDEMVTHTMSLEDINRSFDLMHEGKSIRSVVHF